MSGSTSSPPWRTGLRPWRKALGLVRFARNVRGLLTQAIDAHAAAATIARGAADREARFLWMLDAKVWTNPASPYRRLLAAAGCERGDVAGLVRRDGLDVALRRLSTWGVHVRFDEMKGRTPAVRGSQTFHFRAEDFDDPLVTPELALSSAGTRGAPQRVPIDTGHIAELAPAWAVFLAEQGSGTAAPLLFWTPGHAGIAARYLACAIAGYPYARWFVSEEMRSTIDRVYARCVHGLSRRAGGFPAPERAPFSAPDPVLECLRALVGRRERPLVNTAPSAAARLALLARERGVGLGGVTFLLGAEPLTRARRATIEASGARAAVLYGSSEAPWIAGQCRSAPHGDGVHLLRDGYAVVAGDDAAGGGGADRPLLLTSLRGAVPKVLLNADIGDRAVLRDGRCDCLYDRLDCRQQLHLIRSSDKITELGVTFAVRHVQHVLEAVLPRRLGGTAGDYQLVEERDAAGLPHYTVRVRPGVGAVSDSAVVATFLAALGGLERHYRPMVSTWERAGAVRVRRGNALAGPSGKVLAFHRVPDGAGSEPGPR